MTARKSKVAKARAALQSRLATVPAKVRELDQATALLQEATRREHELIEARANELVEDLRDQLERTQMDVEHLRTVRGDLLAQQARTTEAAHTVAQELELLTSRQSKQAATIHRLGTEVEYHEDNARTWRNVALALGTLAIIFGGLLGNQLL